MHVSFVFLGYSPGNFYSLFFLFLNWMVYEPAMLNNLALVYLGTFVRLFVAQSNVTCNKVFGEF